MGEKEGESDSEGRYFEVHDSDSNSDEIVLGLGL